MTVIVPTLRHERRLWNEGLTRVVGVDEVGVAPTCGAVVAAAVIMKPGCHRIPGVRDSKTLSMGQRERLAPIIRSRAVAVGVGAARVREVDQLELDLLADPGAWPDAHELLEREATPVMADDAMLDATDLAMLDGSAFAPGADADGLEVIVG